jgi:hypothetical protein
LESRLVPILGLGDTSWCKTASIQSSVADPDPGSKVFLPTWELGYGIRDKFFSGTVKNTSIKRQLARIFCTFSKINYFKFCEIYGNKTGGQNSPYSFCSC